ncbi:hypothetical protein B0H13DRAFT_2113526, partial [Mycena leptocephala]
AFGVAPGGALHPSLALALWAASYLPPLISIDCDCDCDCDYDSFHGHNDGSCAVGRDATRSDSRLPTPYGHLLHLHFHFSRNDPSPLPAVFPNWDLGFWIWDFDGPRMRDFQVFDG